MRFFRTFVGLLIINFGALGIGSWLMNNGPQSEWYTSLNQAPWTPPGWVFGAAWTTIMVCFSVYMTYLFLRKPLQKLTLLFLIQFVLNVSWNYIFFNQHLVGLSLAVILGLTVLVGFFMVSYRKEQQMKTLLILPYFIWLCIASSLNAYILLNN